MGFSFIGYKKNPRACNKNVKKFYTIFVKKISPQMCISRAFVKNFDIKTWWPAHKFVSINQRRLACMLTQS
jgi:hypothetical protein